MTHCSPCIGPASQPSAAAAPPPGVVSVAVDGDFTSWLRRLNGHCNTRANGVEPSPFANEKNFAAKPSVAGAFAVVSLKRARNAIGLARNRNTIALARIALLPRQPSFQSRAPAAFRRSASSLACFYHQDVSSQFDAEFHNLIKSVKISIPRPLNYNFAQRKWLRVQAARGVDFALGPDGQSGTSAGDRTAAPLDRVGAPPEVEQNGNFGLTVKSLPTAALTQSRRWPVKRHGIRTPFSG